LTESVNYKRRMFPPLTRSPQHRRPPGLARLAVVLALGALLLVGCNPIAEKAAAEAVVQDYFAALQAKDYDKAWTFWDSASGTREDWLRAVSALDAKLGDLERYELGGWNVESRAGAESGTYYLLQYTLFYPEYSARSELFLFRPASGGEIRILGQDTNWPIEA
jgi:hypothetical protein